MPLAAVLALLPAVAGPVCAQGPEPREQGTRQPGGVPQSIVDNVGESAKSLRLAALKVRIAVNSFAGMADELDAAAAHAEHTKGDTDRFVRQLNDALDALDSLLGMAERLLGGRGEGGRGGRPPDREPTGSSGAVEPARPTAGPGDAP